MLPHSFALITVSTVSIEDVVTPFFEIFYCFFFKDLRMKPPTVPVIPKPNRPMPIVCIKILL